MWKWLLFNKTFLMKMGKKYYWKFISPAQTWVKLSKLCKTQRWLVKILQCITVLKIGNFYSAIPCITLSLVMPALSISAICFITSKPRSQEDNFFINVVLFMGELKYNKLLLPNQHNFANQNYRLMQKCCVFFTRSLLFIFVAHKDISMVSKHTAQIWI